MVTTSQNIKVIWSISAKNDLRFIFKRIKEKTKSLQAAVNVKDDILQQSKQIHFLEQYQIDEFLGEPFRRMVVRNFKIIYKVESKTEIRILHIFDTYQHPKKLR